MIFFFMHSWVYFPIADQVISSRKSRHSSFLFFFSEIKIFEHQNFEPIFMFKIHLKVKWANYTVFLPNIVIEIMLTQHFKTLLQTTVHIPIKSPALFCRNGYANLWTHGLSEERFCFKVRLRSDQIITSVHCTFEFNNTLPQTYTLKNKAKK